MPNTRDNVFSRVFIDYAVTGVTRISWHLRKGFRDIQPHTFQIQVNYNGGGADTEWCAVGSSFINAHSYNCATIPSGGTADDDKQRVFGKKFDVVYRVKLTTPQGVYYSKPANVLGNLKKHQWLALRAMQRRIKLKARSLVSHEGYLLKRKTHGAACGECLDPHTGGITDSNCTTCQGTGIVDGYWQAATDIMYDLSPESKHVQRDNSLNRGTISDIVVRGSFIGVPGLSSRDVWVEKDSDKRYIVHSVKHLAEINQVPVHVAAELRLVEANDIVYNIPLEGN